MNTGITGDPMVKALLKHLADERGENDPVGELSREILKGETSPVDLLRSTWYGEGLASAVEAGQAQLNQMPAEQRAKLEEAAARLREMHDVTGSVDS
jgi:hypothetical protein